MGRSAGKRSVPFQSQIPCSPCPGLTALAGVSCGIGGQPVLEVGVVGADEDGGVFLVKIDFGGLFLLGKSCSHRLILSAALSRNRGVFQVFSSALDLGKMAIFKQERAGRCLPCPTRSHSIKCVFSGSTQESASFVPRDRFFSERMEESPQIITLKNLSGGSGLMRTAIGWWKKPITTYLPAMKEALYPAEIRGTKIP